MSLVILAPPARKFVVFEDGDLSPPAQLDEDYGFSQFAELVRPACAQPLIDEYVLPLQGKQLDEDYAFAQIGWQALRFQQPLSDDYVLALLAIDDGEPPALGTFKGAQRSFPQFFGEDELPVIVVSIVEDDVDLPMLVLRQVSAAQPITADEERPLTALAPADESPGIQAPTVQFSAFWRQSSLEDDLPPQQSVLLEDDAGVPIASLFGPPFAQPATDDETFAPPVVTQLDDDARFVLPQIALAGYARQPFNFDDDLPIVVTHAIDEDYVVVSVQAHFAPFAQPAIADEERPLPARIVDDERTDHSLLRQAFSLVWQQPPFAAFDEIGAAVHYRGELLELKARDMRITLLPPDRRISLRSSTERRFTLPRKPEP